MTDTPNSAHDLLCPTWWIYRGTGEVRADWSMPAAPPWRTFDGTPDPASEMASEAASTAHGSQSSRQKARDRAAATYAADPKEVRLVNAAIYLRRPLLVTGRPGTGKSMLAYSIARELDLGPVLHWSISSRTTLAHGVYQYDAIGRLQEANIGAALQQPADRVSEIGRYIRLGPLGTALLPRSRPRVLLIDEIDKGDVDLPNDLLAILEDGEYQIPELSRLPDEHPPVKVMTADGTQRPQIEKGVVRCAEFPIVVMTSNREREFPPAFLRRCVRLDLDPPQGVKLKRILDAHLGGVSPQGAILVERFLEAQEVDGAVLATDQLLNALRMEDYSSHGADPGWPEVLDALLRRLDPGS